MNSSCRVCVLIILIVSLVSVSFGAGSYEGKNTLVLLDDLSNINLYSKFFNALEQRGYELEYSTPNNKDLKFDEFGEFLFNNLIYFAPHTDDLAEGLSSDKIVEFIDAGHDVLIAGDYGASYIVDEILDACGLILDSDSDAVVIDHLNFDESDADGQHTFIVANGFTENVPNILNSNKINPILYRGIGMAVNRDNTLIMPLIRGSTSAYSSPPDKRVTDLSFSGKNLVLAASLQARNNARVSVTGSIEMFSDEFFDHKVKVQSTKEEFASGNEYFVTELAKWTFHERGLLRLSNPTHTLENGKTPEVYAVKEKILYSVDIEEWNGEEWVPYKADDVQLEFVMLDPYYRINLEHDNEGHYSTTFIAPDVYGVYTFKIAYFRVGYTSIESKIIATVRPLRHDEYERFIPAAFPYYASAFSMMGGVLLFSVLFLFNKDKN